MAARSPDVHFAIGAARAFGGAVIFSLPLLMTMEMWWLGFTMDRGRLALFLVVLLPVLVALSYFAGFEKTGQLKHDAVDAFVALAIGTAASAIVLALFGVVRADDPAPEIVGKIALQAVPASIGALLAQSQLGGGDRAEVEERRGKTGYWGEVFLMGVGALFLAFNVAPTEEMVLIAYQMTAWQAVVLVLVSLAVMHAFVFAMEFRGQHPRGRFWSDLLRFSVVGYVVALAVSAYSLYTFGRLDGSGFTIGLVSIVVLGFPAAVGAAAARLIL